MNDLKSRDIVSYVLNEMGYKKLSKFVKDESVDLNPYINLIKYKFNKIFDIKEIVDYFL